VFDVHTHLPIYLKTAAHISGEYKELVLSVKLVLTTVSMKMPVFEEINGVLKLHT